MEKEIITTKKKLTISIIDQIREKKFDELENAEVIPCSRHRFPDHLSYLQYYDYYEAKIRRGAKQVRCPKCKRWCFKSEY